MNKYLLILLILPINLIFSNEVEKNKTANINANATPSVSSTPESNKLPTAPAPIAASSESAPLVSAPTATQPLISTAPAVAEMPKSTKPTEIAPSASTKLTTPETSKMQNVEKPVEKLTPKTFESKKTEKFGNGSMFKNWWEKLKSYFSQKRNSAVVSEQKTNTKAAY